MKLLVATQNAGKLREFEDALSDVPVELLGLADRSEWASLEAPPETGGTFLENAVLKSMYYHRATGLPAVADDSGLEVDRLDGAPGLHSARFLGEGSSYATKMAKILEDLEGVPRERRTARFYAALAVVEAGRATWSVVEICEGVIGDCPRGTDGFGYDPIFVFPPLGKTFGEASIHEKRTVSARGKALLRLAEHLRAREPS